MATMVTIKKEATVIFTQEFILDKPSLVKCLPGSLCWKIYKSAGDVLICRTGRHSWCRQEAESHLTGKADSPQALEEEERMVLRTKCRAVHHMKGSVVRNSSMKWVFWPGGHGLGGEKFWE